MANVKKFTEKYGIEVRVDNESWEDVRPKAAVAANAGAGPDIILSTNDDANLYPDKLVDVTDVCNYLGKKYGGWYPVCEQYLQARRQQMDRRPAGLRRQRDRVPREPGEGSRLRQLPEGPRRIPEAHEGAQGQGHARRLRARARHRRPVAGPTGSCGRIGGKLVEREEPGRDQQPGDHQGAGIRQGAVRRPSCPARCPGWTRTTTRRSWTARSASRTTASRSTTPPRPRRTPSCRRWPRTSSTPTSRSARSASPPSSTCSSTRWSSSTPSTRRRPRSSCAS